MCRRKDIREFLKNIEDLVEVEVLICNGID